jgi:hypothetical protein
MREIGKRGLTMYSSRKPLSAGAADRIIAEWEREVVNKDDKSFLHFDLSNPRFGKRQNNRYYTVNLKDTNGKLYSLSKLSWACEPTSGKIKPHEERKGYAPTLQFRESSELGRVLSKIMDEFKRVFPKYIESGQVKVRKDKSNISIPVQRETDDGTEIPDGICRIGLPFYDDGQPKFELFKMVQDTPDSKPIKVSEPCSSQDIHEKIQAQTLTTGVVDIGSVALHSFGISIPSKVIVLVIKPGEPEVPDVSEIMDEDQMLMMCVPRDSQPQQGKKNDNPENEESRTETNTESHTESPMTIEEQLEQLSVSAK